MVNSWVEIVMSNGARTLVDEADAAMALRYPWGPGGSKSRYATSHDQIDHRTIYLHRLVACAPQGAHVDHINRDSLDNRRANLRIVTNALNHQNLGTNANNTTGFRGVTRSKHGKSKPFVAQITINGRHICGGYFATAEEAALAAVNLRAIYMPNSQEAVS